MLVLLHVLIQAGLIVRVLLRRHRDPVSRLAWILVILALPVVGIIAYLLLGETSIGRHRAARLRQVTARLPAWRSVPGVDTSATRPAIADRLLPLFRVGQSISGFAPVGGNRAELMHDSDAAIDRMVADIDGAKRHVHLLFYIWLPDNNGTAVAAAVERAAARGVACRVLVDDVGSKALIRSQVWRSMASAGVEVARALPVGDPLVRAFRGRIDLRNHRKIAVIDDRITYCGSQNCADPAFLPKARYGPWVDVLVRFEGPIARQNQFVFATDWMSSVDEDITDLLGAPLPPAEPGFAAQVIASGPTAHYSAMPEMFETLMYSARRELFITTPYYVPIESTQAALRAAGNRGVDTTIVFPARNDDFAVGAISRSYYEDLLAAGVKIYEYGAGLLHAKTLTVDDDIALIGSANMDRRSFDLNYENNILLCDAQTTAELRERQMSYVADCRQVTADDVAVWPWSRRLWSNTLAMLGPVL